MDSGLFINWMLGILTKKVVIPSDFHEQVKVVELMLKDDLSGLVDTLTDFSVNSANVDFKIETNNKEFTDILSTWLDEINKGYGGKIPSGIKPLAKEYFKERWKYSSFPVMKIAHWGKVNDIIVPDKMFFVDGGSIYAKDKEKGESLNLFSYDYYLGSDTKKEDKLDKNVLITKTNGRWFDKYPTPYLIKRGVYHNWKIVESIKAKEIQILEQVIPYLLLVKKGTSELNLQKDVSYSNEELRNVLDEFKNLLEAQKDSTSSTNTPMRVTNFDEEIKHLIPDLSTIFDTKLFAQAERNMLAGLGFIDVIEAVSTSRRESILNPKAFIQEINAGVTDFKQILKELVFLIKEKNKTHKKYINSEFYISSSPVTAFLTDDFKEKLRQLYDRGRISSQTAVEVMGEVDFRTEKFRRKRETEEGVEIEMYPPVTKNQEDKGIDLPGDSTNPEDTDPESIPDDKKDIVERENFDISKDDLVGAPFTTIKSLPKQVKTALDSDLQSVFLRVFNNAFHQYDNETRAFRVAWSVIRQIGRKDKKGKWHRKRKRVNGKLMPQKLTRAIVAQILEKEENQAIEEAMIYHKAENEKKRGLLLDHLLKQKDKDKK